MSLLSRGPGLWARLVRSVTPGVTSGLTPGVTPGSGRWGGRGGPGVGAGRGAGSRAGPASPALAMAAKVDLTTSTDWKGAKSFLKGLSDKQREEHYFCRDFVRLKKIPTWKETAKGVQAKVEEPKYKKDKQLNEKISLLRGDITKLEVDAIVNAAPQLPPGDSESWGSTLSPRGVEQNWTGVRTQPGLNQVQSSSLRGSAEVDQKIAGGGKNKPNKKASIKIGTTKNILKSLNPCKEMVFW
uniref:Macro domain-containing protein n=1 Tax=Ornithorhynchus anatinus TaxID=9258 RepID=A0A6I8PFJ0_ORNAN